MQLRSAWERQLLQIEVEEMIFRRVTHDYIDF